MTLHFELVSPEKLLLSQDVEMAILSGIEGDMGILQDHTPLISILRPGVVTLMNNGKAQERIFVQGGFVEVTPQSCIVLAEHASKLSEIDLMEAERELADCKADFTDAKNEIEREKIGRKVAIAEAKIEALQKSVY